MVVDPAGRIGIDDWLRWTFVRLWACLIRIFFGILRVMAGDLVIVSRPYDLGGRWYAVQQDRSVHGSTCLSDTRGNDPQEKCVSSV